MLEVVECPHVTTRLVESGLPSVSPATTFEVVLGTALERCFQCRIEYSTFRARFVEGKLPTGLV